MSEAEIRFRMPEGVDIGARLPFLTRSRSTAACPFAGHRGVAPGGVRWPELSGAPRRRSEPAWVPIAPASPGVIAQITRGVSSSNPRPVPPRASPGPRSTPRMLRCTNTPRSTSSHNKRSHPPPTTTHSSSLPSSLHPSTGPLNIPLNTKIHTVKELVVTEWPTEKVGKPPPEDPREIRLIHNGKVMEPGKCLGDYKVAVGSLVTCHLLVQPKPEPVKGGGFKGKGGNGDGSAAAPGCGCVVC